LLGKYRLLAELGHGGMADVYLAAHDGIGAANKLVVIKRLRNLEDPQHMTMFLDEARIARRLSHPNIVQTHEIGQEAGSHFIAMEYLHGPTLQRLRAAAADQQQIVPWEIEIEILCNLLEGLHYAHELRGPDGRPLHVVHRDFSPENVIVTHRGDCKILDFGIAKAIDSLTHTQAGFAKGKLKNMPPEQLQGQKVDRRADIYAAGVMLWEGLSGQSLWGDIGNAAIATRILQNQLPPLEEIDPNVPAELRAMCMRCLAADANQRYATALELKADLTSYLARHQLQISKAQLAAFVEPLFAEERERIDRIVQTLLSSRDPIDISMPVPLPSAEAFTAAERTPPKRQGSMPARRMPDPPHQVSPSVEMDAPEWNRRRGFTGRRLATVMVVAVLLGLSIYAGARLANAPKTPEVAVPAIEPVPKVAPPREEPVKAAVREEAARPVAREEPQPTPAPVRARATSKPSPRREAASDARDRLARMRSTPEGAKAAATAPPQAPTDEAPKGESQVRWMGRGLDRDNPYGTAGSTPQTKPKRSIDRTNPFQGGAPE
jgi:serine/threonine-protein kinase